VFFSKCFVSNGSRTGTVLFTLDLPPMPVGLAGLNKNKIVLCALLAFRCFINLSF